MAKELAFRWLLPDTVDRNAQRELARESKVEVAVRLFSTGRISSGYAANLLGLGRRDFLDLLRSRGVPYSRDSAQDRAADAKALRSLGKKPTEGRGRG